MQEIYILGGILSGVLLFLVKINRCIGRLEGQFKEHAKQHDKT